MQELERRYQKRSPDATKATGRTISGYAARFDLPTKIGGKNGFIEVIRRGAFSRCIRQRQDVRMLANHQGLPVARTINGTLSLQEDDKGLRFRCDVAQTSLGDTLLELLRTQTLSGCSFSFAVPSGGDRWSSTIDGSTGRRCDLRELLDLDLFDTSIVTYPAYGGTSALRDTDEDEDDEDEDEDNEPLVTLAAAASGSRSMPVELRSRITRVVDEFRLQMTPEEREVYTQGLLLETKADR